MQMMMISMTLLRLDYTTRIESCWRLLPPLTSVGAESVVKVLAEDTTSAEDATMCEYALSTEDAGF
jgi:hypothetical protein